MRTSVLLLLTLLGCSGKSDEPAPSSDEDSENDSTSGEDEDTEGEEETTDTGTDKTKDSGDPEDTGPLAEDCDDGQDNDGDGLVDCEDEDCLESCLEDCDDGEDNDGDGLLDCADDECFGDEACQGQYSLTLETSLDEVRLATGSMVEDELSYGAFLIATGTLVLVGTPLGESDTPFSCTGSIQVGPTNWGDGEFNGTTWEEKTCDSCSYQFSMSPSVTTGSLIWEDICPVETLPSASIGAAHGWNQLTRLQDESWTPWYTSGTVEILDALPDLYYTTIGSLLQKQAVQWTATSTDSETSD